MELEWVKVDDGTQTFEGSALFKGASPDGTEIEEDMCPEDLERTLPFCIFS